jgi:hypothetical protein
MVKLINTAMLTHLGLPAQYRWAEPMRNSTVPEATTCKWRSKLAISGKADHARRRKAPSAAIQRWIWFQLAMVRSTSLRSPTASFGSAGQRASDRRKLPRRSGAAAKAGEGGRASARQTKRVSDRRKLPRRSGEAAEAGEGGRASARQTKRVSDRRRLPRRSGAAAKAGEPASRANGRGKCTSCPSEGPAPGWQGATSEDIRHI